jgi:hypothetical protein
VQARLQKEQTEQWKQDSFHGVALGMKSFTKDSPVREVASFGRRVGTGKD